MPNISWEKLQDFRLYKKMTVPVDGRILTAVLVTCNITKKVTIVIIKIYFRYTCKSMYQERLALFITLANK